MTDESFQSNHRQNHRAIVGANIDSVENTNNGFVPYYNGVWVGTQTPKSVNFWRVITLFFLVMSGLSLLILPLLPFALVAFLGIKYLFSKKSSHPKGLSLIDDKLIWHVGAQFQSVNRDDIVGVDLHDEQLAVMFKVGPGKPLGTIVIKEQLKATPAEVYHQLFQWRDQPLDTVQAQENAKRDKAWAERIYHIHQLRHWLPRRVSRAIPLGLETLEQRQAFLRLIKPYDGRLKRVQKVVDWTRILLPMMTIWSAVSNLWTCFVVIALSEELLTHMMGPFFLSIFAILWVWIWIYKNNWKTRVPTPFDFVLAFSVLGAWIYVGSFLGPLLAA